jgi:Zn-dependent M28 family amino/carboxypeptidase
MAAALRAAEPASTPEGRIRDDVTILASDAFEGRAPGTRGEERTVAYLIEQCKQIGLQPGNPDGSYIQKVPLLGVTTQSTVTWSAGGATGTWRPNVDVVAPSLRMEPHLSLKDSEVVFVGYGVTAPEYGWDDYKNSDVRGKTVVMLINDPPVTLKDDPTKLDPAVFDGKGMTYYGRWTYKYENAAAHGAAACLIIHETGPAAYPFSVVVDSRSRENFGLLDRKANHKLLNVEGWLSLEAATDLLAHSGKDFATLKSAACSRDFQAIPLSARIGFEVVNTVREVQSKNVAALLPGSDPLYKDEFILLSAHWDHLGITQDEKGTHIFHGALDNASGVAQFLEVARQFQALPADRKPRRSMLFLFTTSEEKNLLGAKYYAAHPLHPLAKTLADLNLDMGNPYAATDDIAIVGMGQNSVEDIAARVAATQKRTTVPFGRPETGSYFRADHFEFARAGIPCLYISIGEHFHGMPDDFAKRFLGEYVATHYHKPEDQVQDDWTYEGMTLDAEFLGRVALEISAAGEWPHWYDKSEYKATRERTLSEARR